MANWREPDWLVGRRFVADLTVVSVGAEAADGSRTVRLHMHGDRYDLSLEELQTLIERGFVVEAPLPTEVDSGDKGRRGRRTATAGG